MATIRANGIQIYYELHGPPDGQVLVLSNGILMSTASWVMQIPALSERYRLLLYDCRGMWQSEHPEGPYSMALHADDLAALLEALEIRRAHIGGISYGAELSMVFALRYPQKTGSLLIASAVSQVDPRLRAMIQAWLLCAQAGDAELFYQVTYPQNFSEAWIAAHAEALAAAKERYQDLDYVALERLIKAFLDLDITDELSAIQAPTLVMVGEQDILKPRPYAERIAAAIPGADLAVIPRAGHAVCWEKPHLFNALILGFLAMHPLDVV